MRVEFVAIADREFWSVLTAFKQGEPRMQLAYFHWRLVHSVKFAWNGGKCRVATADESVTFDPVKKKGFRLRLKCNLCYNVRQVLNSMTHPIRLIGPTAVTSQPTNQGSKEHYLFVES